LEGVPRFNACFMGPIRPVSPVPSPRSFFRSSMRVDSSIWLLFAPAGVWSLFLLPIPQTQFDAARGGRIGGGSFRFRSSFSRGGAGNFRGGARGGGGFGVAESDSRSLSRCFGFGGGGLFGFPDLMTIAGCWSTPCAAVGQAAVVFALPSANGRSYVHQARGPVAVAQLQVGLLANCSRELQRSGSAAGWPKRPTTSNSAGLP